MLHGGPGNDLMYGGDDYYGTGGGMNGKLWMYGDEGNDEMWGKNEVDEEYIRGGEGHDDIYGGYGATISILNGNGGDDRIIPGAMGDNANENTGTTNASTIRGGKGNDIINPTRINTAGDNFEPDVNKPNQASKLGGAKTQGINW